MKRTKIIALLTALIFIFPTVVYSIKKYRASCEVKRALDPKFQIDTIIQTGLVKEALPTLYLAELLDLSQDEPQNSVDFSERVAEEKLCLSPTIKRAKVKKYPPSAIHIDYEIRTPIAELVDFTNTGIDKEGAVFPMSPFFAPRKLPRVYFGLEDLPTRLTGEKVELALRILEMLDKQNLTYISVRDAFHQSCGKREIVIIFEEGGKKHYLRLSTKNYPQELGNYLTIKDQFSKEMDQIIDLRIENLAYFEEVPEHR